MRFSGEAAERARHVRFLLLDVDGVLTDGRIFMIPGQEDDEIKSFHSQDGLGIRLAQRAGVAVGLLTGRTSSVVARRARELEITEVHQGVGAKLPAYEALLRRLGLADAHVCYVGDDLADMPILERVGLPAAVADARHEVRRRAAVVSTRPGGLGAVRDIIDGLLHAQGNWERAVAAVVEGSSG